MAGHSKDKDLYRRGAKHFIRDLGNNRQLKVSCPMKGEIKHEFGEYD
jgi:hypothetical protein